MESSLVSWPNAAFFDQHWAPGFSDFAGAVLEDLRDFDDQQQHWLANYFLSQIDHEFKPVYRELIFNFIRRAQEAFDSYHELREQLSTYPSLYRAPRPYFSALSKAETCIASAAQAFEIARAYMARSGNEPQYTHVSDEQVDRLHRFYIAQKHIADMLAGSQFHGQDTLIFWFTPSGLQSRKRGLLSFEALAALLKELAVDARLLSTWGPSPGP